MKKLMMVVIAVAVAFAFNAWATGTTTKEEVKVDKTATGTKVEVKEKGPEGKIDAKVEKSGTTVTGTVTEKPKGDSTTVETKVTFKKYEQAGDFIYVVSEGKELKLKHTLKDSAKKDMLTWKEGTPVTITSTYALTPDQVAKAVAVDAKLADSAAKAAEKAK